MTWGLVYWPFAIIIVAAVFLPAEFYALFTNPANTLSDYCWRQLNVSLVFGHGAHTLAWWLSIIMWGIFVVLITLHIWYRSI